MKQLFSYKVKALPFYPFQSILYIGKAILIFHATQKFFSEVIKIDIEIKKRSIVKEFFHKLHSTSEDLLFRLIMRLPEKFIPSVLMDLLDRYTTRRIRQLKQQNIKNTWRTIHLENVVNDINIKTQKEAPSDV